VNYEMPDSCTRCGFKLFSLDEELDDGTVTAVCGSCGSRVEVYRKPVKKVEVPISEKAPPRLRLPLTRTASQQRYRNSPAGQAAWERYRRSELYYQAHARHRQTQKYKETQERFKKKRRLFLSMLYPLIYTCELKLFWKGENGEVYNNQELCDLRDGDCTFGCIKEDGNGPRGSKENL